MAESLLCAFTRTDTSVVSSVELKQCFRLNWWIFFSKFKGEGNWFSTRKSDYYGQLIPVSLMQTVPNCWCMVMAAVQVDFSSKYSTRGRVPVQMESGTHSTEIIQKRSPGTKYRLPWSTLRKIVQGQLQGGNCL